MNISELARKLKTTTKELKEILPQAGFDIGQRAIKVDDRIALKIIDQWNNILERRKLNQNASSEEDDSLDESLPEKTIIINIPRQITVKNFAKVMDLPLTQIISELMKNGIMVSLNERIDFETAKIIAEDLGVPVELQLIKEENDDYVKKNIKEIIKENRCSELKERPPVIVVMGHVDHGKTKLLDAIRQTNVVDGESGGITQHIGAYQAVVPPKSDPQKPSVESASGRALTFIDTPGHEAFTAMRSRGAQVADIAILIVAADDGVMPQTEEAYKIIKNAGIPFVVAINKIDKPGSNVEKTKQELVNKLNVVPEEWGGKALFCLISAKQKQGINELLEALLLITDMEKDNFMANYGCQAAGTIIDSNLNKSEGPVATILIQTGILRINDYLFVNESLYGKNKAMKDFRGKAVSEATPSMPVKILGFKTLPNVGDVVTSSVETKNQKFKKKSKLSQKRRQSDSRENRIIDDQLGNNKDEGAKRLNIILKTDVLGSQEAIIESLEKIEKAEVKLQIVRNGLGNITDSDIERASAQNSQILGFHVKSIPSIEIKAKEKKIPILHFEVIYELIDYVQNEMNRLIPQKIKRVKTGEAEIKAVFRKEDSGMIIGGMVTNGKIVSGAKATVKKAGKIMAEGKIVELQSNKDIVAEVKSGKECGIKYSGKPVIQPGDVLESWKDEIMPST